MNEIVIAAIGLAGAAAGGIGAYLIARRKGSGRVITSEATDLWKESAALRRDLYNEVTVLRSDLAKIRAEHANCQVQLANLTSRLEVLSVQVERE